MWLIKTIDPAVESADSVAPPCPREKGSGRARRRLSKPPLAELRPKKLHLLRMAEMNVKSDAGI
jgi:hypothetical protein